MEEEMITQVGTAAKRILTKGIQTNLADRDLQPVATQAVMMETEMMETMRMTRITMAIQWFQPSTDTLYYQVRNGLHQVTDQANQEQSSPLAPKTILLEWRKSQVKTSHPKMV